MSNGKLSRRYAKSLIDLAKEQNALDAAFSDMQHVLNSCKSSREFSVMLKSPVISTDKKVAILSDYFSTTVSQLTLSFILLLAKKRRESYVEEIAASFVEQYRAIKGIATAVVSTPVQLTEEAKKKILEIVEGATKAKVELTEVINPELIGGFILRVGDKQVDTSISTKINLLKRDFSKNLYVKDF